MQWFLVLMAVHADIQTKIQVEISEIIGERKPEAGDRIAMPFTQATIHEVMRFSSIVPVNMPHVALFDTQYGGYTVPQSYELLINFWAIHHDKAYWREPEMFDPTRFLSEDGTKVVKRESFMPLSFGKVMCPGDQIAGVELFLYATVLLQRYLVKAPENKLLNLTPRFLHFFHTPQHLELVFEERS